MTNLTEQWKKGELKDGKYWVQLSFGGTIITAEYLEYNGVFELDDHYYEDEEISKVLAPVPSYEECQKLLSDQLAKIEGEEINAELEAKIKEKETQRIELMMKLNDVNNENHALRVENSKLKEAVEFIKKGLQETIEGYRMTPIARAEFLLKELNEVLK